MSTLKVNKLRDTSGSTDAITLDPSGGAVLAGVTTVTSVKVGAAVTITESGSEASGIGITCANINGTQIGGRRNIIINGAMEVAQRGTSTTTATAGYHTLDRFLTSHNGTDEAVTISQSDVASGTTPYTLGFRKALKFLNGNQTGGADAGDFTQVQTRLEAQDIAKSGWNYTSSSSFITLSFWVKSSVAQNFYAYFRTTDGTAQLYTIETGSLTADTWTKVTKKIPGNSNLQFDNNADQGLQLVFAPFWGTTYTDSGKSLNSWGAYVSTNRTPDFTTTWWTTNDATWEITGIQLEVGPQATPFEHRSLGEEMSLCQRYFQKYTCTAQEWIYVEGAGAQYKWWQAYFNPMRDQPSVDLTGLSTGGNAAGGSGTISSIALVSVSDGGGNTNGRVSVRVTWSTSWGTAYNVHHLDAWNGESITFSSEL